MKKYFIIILIIIKFIDIQANTIEIEQVNEIFTGNIYQGNHTLIYEDSMLFATGQYGLEIYSIDENGLQEQISILPIGKTIGNILKLGNIVILSGTDGLNETIYQVNVADPYNPIITNQITGSDYVNFFIQKSETLIYYTAFYSDPDTSCTFFLDPNTFEVIHSQSFQFSPIWLKGNFYMFRSATLPNSVDVFDFSDFNNIELVSSFEFTAESGIFVTPVSSSLLVLHNQTHCWFYDILNPTNITFISQYNLLTPINAYTDGILLIENYLLITNDSRGIEVIDITDIDNPVFGSATEICIQANPVYDGNYVYVANMSGKIYKYNFNQENLENEILEINNFTSLGYPLIKDNTLITGIGSYNDDEKLIFWDISDPQSPEISARFFHDCWLSLLKENNNYIYAKFDDGYSNGLNIIDISDINNIQIIEQIGESSVIRDFKLDSLNNRLISYNVEYYNNYIELKTYDIIDNVNLDLNNCSQYEIPSVDIPVQGAIQGDNLYINVNNNILIFNGIENGELNFVDSIDSDALYIWKIFTIDDYLITYSYNVCQVFSLTNPDQPEILFTIRDKITSGAPYIKNDILFLHLNNQLELFDLSSDGNPDFDAFHSIPLNSRNAIMIDYSDQYTDYFYILQSECLGVYEYNITVDNSETEIQPVPFKLSNYPNPFNPTTQISFSLPNDTVEASIEIYNIKGQEIKSIECDNISSGKHNVNWNGKNKNNQAVCSGVYLYKLIINNRIVSSSKMMLIK